MQHGICEQETIKRAHDSSKYSYKICKCKEFIFLHLYFKNHNLVNLSEINGNIDATEEPLLPEANSKNKSFTEVLTNLVMKQYKASKKVK